MELALNTLKHIGLTEIEAKIYIFLAKKGPSNQKELADTMKMSPQQLGYNLKVLQIKGFVNHVTAAYTVFSAVPLEKVLNHLAKKQVG